jgi:hypothetical protein
MRAVTFQSMVAHVVPGLVLAQIGEIDAEAVKEAAIIALEQAVQAPDDRPVQALQNPIRQVAVRRGRGRG